MAKMCTRCGARLPFLRGLDFDCCAHCRPVEGSLPPARSSDRGPAREFVLISVAILFGCCGLPLLWLNDQRMYDRPELIYPRYESRLKDYGRRLSAGEVNYEETRKYGIPQYLINHGARYCTKHGDCFCVTFGFIADSAVPELWYSPSGFDPLPAELAHINRNGVHVWIPLAPQWAACYR